MEIFILVPLILLSGFFAMSEISIGESRLGILTQMAEKATKTHASPPDRRNHSQRLRSTQ